MSANARSSQRRQTLVPRRFRAPLAGLAAGLLLAATGEWALVGSLAAENDELRGRLAALQTENAKIERMIADYETFKRDAAEIEARFATALEAVPSEAELTGALQDLEQVTRATGVDLVRFTPGALPRATKKPAGRGQTEAVAARPITIVVRSTFSDFRSLLDRIALYPRLLTVEGFSMRSTTNGRYTLEASVRLNCYYKQAPAEPQPEGRK